MPEFPLSELMLSKESFSANLRPEDAEWLRDHTRTNDHDLVDIRLLVVAKQARRRVVDPEAKNFGLKEEPFDEPRIFGTTMADNLAGPHQTRAMAIVRQYIMSQLEKTDPVPDFEIYIVWFCFILGGWKALISTSLPDGMYYEVTRDHHKSCIYLDAYKKFANQIIRD